MTEGTDSTTIIDGYVYITESLVSGNTIDHTKDMDGGNLTADSKHCVPIAVGGNIKHDTAKTYKNVSGYVSRGMWDEKDPYNWILDLKTIVHVITVTGKLFTDSVTTAKVKKQNLHYLIGAGTGENNRRGGVFTIVWGTGNNREQYTCNGNKITITEDSNIETTAGNRAYLDIMAQFMIGTNR